MTRPCRYVLMALLVAGWVWWVLWMVDAKCKGL
jgi:hypothetical protein